MRGLSIALILCLLLSACAAENASPTPESVAEGALPLLGIIASCADICSFDASPPETLAAQAVCAYFSASSTPSEAETPAHAYSSIFAYGEYPPDGEIIDYIPFPVKVSVESAIDNGVGEIIANVMVESDYGYGWEFSHYMDVYLIYDSSAKYSAKIARVFIPD